MHDNKIYNIRTIHETFQKHGTTSVMNLFTNLFGITSLVRLSLSLSLSLSLARSFLAHLETGTKPCPDRFQHDKHATKTTSGLAISSHRFDCNPRGGWTAESIRTATKKRWQQPTTKQNQTNQRPIDHGQVDAGLEESSQYLNPSLPGASSSPTKHSHK